EQDAGGLGRGLDDQYARHHRMAWKVTLEERLVDGDVLDGGDALAGFQFDHAVDQEERVAVGQQTLDVLHVDRQGDGIVSHAFSFSSAFRRRAMSSRCLKRAAFLRHAWLSCRGTPEEYSPGSRMERVTRLLAVMTTWSATSRWPRIPALPPTMHQRPMRALPATAAQPAMAVWAPTCTLWAIWMRLSRRTSSSSTVSSSAPRSMVVLAPISQSSPIRTPPSCGTLIQWPS